MASSSLVQLLHSLDPAPTQLSNTRDVSLCKSLLPVSSPSTSSHLHDLSPEDDALTLKERLQTASLVSITGDRFIPDAQLRKIVHASSVKRELERSSCTLPKFLLDVYARAICDGKQNGTGPTRVGGALLRIFAILVLIDRPHAITSFLHDGVDDLMLPLSFTRKPVRIHAPSAFGSCFDGWYPSELEAFTDHQWSVLPPLLENPLRGRDFPQLNADYILPFTKDGEVDSNTVHGGFSEVFKVISHHNHSAADKRNVCVPGELAVKRLNSSNTSEKDFSREIEALTKFSGSDNDHPHIIKLLAAFAHRDHYYLIFPWANGNLRSFWRDNPHPIEAGATLFWLARQCQGLAEGMKTIHEYNSKDTSLFGRHGDIKPENILIAKSEDGENRLLITDFGQATFHTSVAELNRDQPKALTPAYRSPEFDARRFVNQKHDIWSLGCVFLELVTWYIDGNDGVKSFAASRRASLEDPGSKQVKDDAFFTIKQSSGQRGRQARLKPSVHNCIDQLHQAAQCSPFCHDLLDLVEHEMLLVDEGNRATSSKVAERLHEMQQRCQKEADYTEPNPTPPKPPWTPKKQKSTHTKRSPGSIDLSQINKELVFKDTVLSINTVHIPNHCQPEHPSGTSELHSQEFSRSAATGPRSTTQQYDPRDFEFASLPDISDSLSIDVMSRQRVAPNKDGSSDKSKRKLDALAPADFLEERPQKRYNLARNQEQEHMNASVFTAEPRDISATQLTDQPLETHSEVQAGQEVFACPFFKRHLERFGPGKTEEIPCAAKPWTIHRLKEHIYRKHCHLRYQCSRCFAAYEKKEDLTDHERAAVQCSLVEAQPECESLTESQVAMLKRRNARKSDYNKWCEIYRIIFGLDKNAKIPAPYWEEMRDHSLADFQIYLDAVSQGGDSGTKEEATICMKYIRAFQDSQSSSKITQNISVPTLAYNSSLLSITSQDLDAETFDCEVVEGAQKELKKFDTQFENGLTEEIDWSNFDWPVDGSWP